MNKEESEQEQEEKEYQSGGKRKSRVQVGKADGTNDREIRVTSNNESPQYAPSNTFNPNNSTNLGLETSSKFFLQKNPQVYSHFNFLLCSFSLLPFWLCLLLVSSFLPPSFHSFDPSLYSFDPPLC